MSVQAKICGVNSGEAMAAAVAGGADYVGLVFYPPSPRAVTAAEAADLVRGLPDNIIKVGLVVDMDDATLAAILSQVSLDLLQLHGAETPERVTEIRALAGLPVMKAIKIAVAEDIAVAERYLGAADRLLFDAKAPPDLKGALPGGNALMFDWTLLAGCDWPLPWMLSGGLDAGNVSDAVGISGAAAVDVSSGVEKSPGVKDPVRIREFLAAVKAL
jgi:phosphoribosylanthranilate isomerase